VQNEETIKAIKQARSGKGITKVKRVNDLMADLNADDSAHQPTQTRLQARAERQASPNAWR